SAVVLPAIEPFSASIRRAIESPVQEPVAHSRRGTLTRSSVAHTDWDALPVVRHVLNRATLAKEPAVVNLIRRSIGQPSRFDSDTSRVSVDPSPGFEHAAAGSLAPHGTPTFAPSARFESADSATGAAPSLPTWAIFDQLVPIKRMVQQLPHTPGEPAGERGR